MSESSSKDSSVEFSGDLEIEDKHFLRDLVFAEIFSERDANGNQRCQYHCVQPCPICSGETTPESLDLGSSVDTNHLATVEIDYSFPFEKRKALMKQVVHEYFVKKWKAEQLENKMQSRVDLNAFQMESTENISDTNSKSTNDDKPSQRLTVLKSEQYNTSLVTDKESGRTFRETYSYKNTQTWRFKKYHNRQKESSERKGTTDRYSAQLKRPPRTHHTTCRRCQSPMMERECHDYSNSRLKQANNYEHKNKRFKGEFDRVPENIISESCTSECNLECAECVGLLVNNTSAPFAIDKEKVDIELYQDGLANHGWNPTQALYEICSQNHWAPPQFYQMNGALADGFLGSVLVQEHMFQAPRYASSKRTARHLAATACLHYLGFCFDYIAPKSKLPQLKLPLL